jgi:aromatic ring-opening dioxygenase catalytic subunit (LigB family)
VLASQDARQHFDMGRALAPLRDEGVLIVGSGMSYHNFAGFRSQSRGPSDPHIAAARTFDR